MGIINRFLLFVLMIGLALLAVLMLLLCMGAVPEPVWLNELHYILSRRETVVASVVVLVLALHLLGVSLRGRAERTRESGDFILLQGAEGGVRVALPAIPRWPSGRSFRCTASAWRRCAPSASGPRRRHLRRCASCST